MPNDTLACGEPYAGFNFAKHVNEHSCQDLNGRRRSGHWFDASGRTRSNRDREAFGEWRVLESWDVKPVQAHHETAQWEETPVAWAECDGGRGLERRGISAAARCR